MNTVTPIAVILTDTHLFEKRTKRDSIIDCNFDEVKKAVVLAINKAKDLGLKYVFHAGDFFDSRKHQSKTLLWMTEQILDLFKLNDIQLVIINGNHDMPDYSDSYSFISPFKYHPSVKHIEKFDFIDIENVRFHFLSFFENETYIQHLGEVKLNLSQKLKNVLITHIGIHGVLKNDGEKERSSILPSMFSEFDKVLIGHYHQYSTHIGGKIIYFGSALQHNFGEDNNKGIIVLDDKLRIQRIKTEFKEYQTIEVDISQITQNDIDDLINQNNDIHQRIVFTGDETLIKALDKTKLIENGIKYTVKSDVIEIQEIEQRIETHSTESILENFNKFCQERGYIEEEGLIYLEKIA